jgi:hypothetical protein
MGDGGWAAKGEAQAEREKQEKESRERVAASKTKEESDGARKNTVNPALHARVGG